MEKLLKKLKDKFTKDNTKSRIMDRVYRAKEELKDAERSFNETVDSDYIDVAIYNLNLAKKKYELSISEAKNFYKAS